MTTFILIWVHEDERWYYAIDEIDESNFPHGYVAYHVEVDENDIIVADENNDMNIGGKFSDCYDTSLWAEKKYFKDYTVRELTDVFNKEKSIQVDIKGMMELSGNDGSPLNYFLMECNDGVYSHSYYNEDGVITI